jgi:hypothetical protein
MDDPVGDELSMRLFPNPVKNTFTLEFELPRRFAKLALEVTDVAGRQVFATRLTNLGRGPQRYVWDATQDLVAGTYVLTLSSGGRLLGRTRFLYGN